VDQGDREQQDELKKKNIRLALILAAVAFGIYVLFILKNL